MERVGNFQSSLWNEASVTEREGSSEVSPGSCLFDPRGTAKL